MSGWGQRRAKPTPPEMADPFATRSQVGLQDRANLHPDALGGHGCRGAHRPILHLCGGGPRSAEGTTVAGAAGEHEGRGEGPHPGGRAEEPGIDNWIWTRETLTHLPADAQVG